MPPFGRRRQQLVSLEAGRTVVLHVSLTGQFPAIFLARSVTAGGFERLAYFEIAPDWLWKDLSGAMLATPVAIVDADGTVLQSTVPSDARDRAHVRRAHQGDQHGQCREPCASWQGAGEEWRGVLTHLPLVDERITTVPWAVVAIDRGATFFARTARGVDVCCLTRWVWRCCAPGSVRRIWCAGTCPPCRPSTLACARSPRAASSV